jgi:hypothetical protein
MTCSFFLQYSKFNLFLLLFCTNELNFIPEMGFLETFKNSALRFCSYIVDYFSIIFFLKSFILNVVSYHLNLLFFHIINFLYEFLSSLKISNSLVCLLVFLLKFDYSCSYLQMLILSLLLVHDCLHHICLNGPVINQYCADSLHQNSVLLFRCWP